MVERHGLHVGKAKSVCIHILLILLLSSAAGVYAQEQGENAPRAGLSGDRDLPRTVAVMPFQNETEDADLHLQVRKAFYNHFSSKPYRDIELPLVDERVIRLEKASGKAVAQLSPHEICEALGCDGLVYGKVTGFRKVYAMVYSQFFVEAEVWLVNAKTGKEVARVKDSVTYHGAGMPITPVGALMSVVSAAMNVRDIQRIRLISELCHKLNEKIPSPEGMAVEDKPVIKEVITNVGDGPFGKGKVLNVGLQGEKELVASFAIGAFKKGLPMKEVEPGVYLGEYHVMPGDTTADMPVVVSLKRIGGGETEWVDVAGTVTIDTTPPPPVAGLRTKGFADRIEVSWSPLKNVSDLKGYRVLRSEQPLSGFSEVAATEQPSFDDGGSGQGIRYYRVIAFDAAGNDSDPQDAVKGILSAREPELLTGPLARDMTLAGTYVVKDAFVVPRGLTLTIEQETKLLFEPQGALMVMGRLVVMGTESPVEFVPLSGERWKGITIEAGSISSVGMRVRGAETALALENSEGAVDRGIFAENETGVRMVGIPSASLRGSTLSNNGTGLEIEKGDARVLENNIFQNGQGIVLRGFSGEIKENNILDNGINIVSDRLVTIGPNWFGTTDPESLGLTNVTVAKVFDGRLPGGKPVDAARNPYTALANEERQKKASELSVEAETYFKRRNYGKAVGLFETSLRAHPTPEAYHYLALSYQEMKDEEKALAALREGSGRFPHDSTLQRALGMLLYQKGDEGGAKQAFEEVLRLNPGDGQVKFLLERIAR